MTDWNDEADGIAEWAHEDNFSSRRGTGSYEEADAETLAVYLYDNNPWANSFRPPHCERRARVLDRVTKRLHLRGLRLLGEACYPEDGETAGYTVAMVFGIFNFPGTAEDAEEALREVWDAEVLDDIARAGRDPIITSPGGSA